MHIVYFDIGGTYTRAEVVHGKQTVFYKKIRTPKELNAFVKQLEKLASNLCLKYKCREINFGVAGRVSGFKIISCANIKYLSRFDLHQIVPSGVKMKVDNDARAWLSRVVMVNKSLRAGTVLGITIGTGIGRAVARNGKVLKIKKFEHREKWEPVYQKRRFEPSKKLAPWFIGNLQPIIEQYKPSQIIFAGGVIEKKKGFAKALKDNLNNL